MGKDCEEEYIVARSSEEALHKAQQKYGKDAEIYQDPDVLDTWFSRFAIKIFMISMLDMKFYDAERCRVICASECSNKIAMITGPHFPLLVGAFM